MKRFIDAQKDFYRAAYKEIEAGGKTSHWIWFIFPQLRSLGFSETAKKYGIADLNEACEYLRQPLLSQRYIEMVTLVNSQLDKIDLVSLMGGETDAKKLMSSLTLFREAAIQLLSQGRARFPGLQNLPEQCDAIFAKVKGRSFFPCETTLKALKETPISPKVRLSSTEERPSLLYHSFFTSINDPNPRPSSALQMRILGGFMLTLGALAIALAFIILNVGTLGAAGVMTAGAGSLLCGSYVFKKSF